MTREQREKIEREVREQVERERAAKRQAIKELALVRLLADGLRNELGANLDDPAFALGFAKAVYAVSPSGAEVVCHGLADLCFGPEPEASSPTLEEEQS